MQAIVDAWQKGLLALTHKSAYDKGIPIGFMGNALDFIEIPTEDTDLAYVAVMAQYFATFFFDKSSHAKAFEDIVESSFGKPSHFNIYSIEQHDLNRMNQLVKFDGISNEFFVFSIFHFVLFYFIFDIAVQIVGRHFIE